MCVLNKQINKKKSDAVVINKLVTIDFPWYYKIVVNDSVTDIKNELIQRY